MEPTRVHSTLQALKAAGFRVNVSHHRRIVGSNIPAMNMWEIRERKFVADPKGGTALVTISQGDVVATGYAQTVDYDPLEARYNRKLLTAIALGRAVRSLERAGRWKRVRR